MGHKSTIQGKRSIASFVDLVGGVKTLLQIFSFVLYTGIEATVEIGKVTDFVVILLSHGKLEGPSQVEIQV